MAAPPVSHTPSSSLKLRRCKLDLENPPQHSSTCDTLSSITNIQMAKRVFFVAHGGVVQGVGFRYFARKRAEEYGITGWCRNTADNKVEGEAQGDEDTLSKFLKDVDQGPRHAKVGQLTREDRDVIEGETSFSIRH